ncbi:hypothetical protein [Nonomuraea dietziae]|uniref:hypothetical protein n=1 Tax=Nonomuraea dietziae TaxID=65515 RepID=UPI003CD06356
MSTPTGNDVIDASSPRRPPRGGGDVHELSSSARPTSSGARSSPRRSSSSWCATRRREAYLYPAVRDILPDGDKLADRELAEHAQADRDDEAAGADRRRRARARRAAGTTHGEIRDDNRGGRGRSVPAAAQRRQPGATGRAGPQGGGDQEGRTDQARIRPRPTHHRPTR